MNQFTNLLLFGATVAAAYCAERLNDLLGRRESVLPAERGLHGEYLIRGDRSVFAKQWLVATVLTVAVPIIAELVTRRVAAEFAYWFTISGAIAALQGMRYLAIRSRFRLAIVREGVVYRRWWARRVRVLPWDRILRVLAESGVEIIPDDGAAGIHVPVGMRGHDELLDALEAHVPRNRWDESFAKAVAKTASRRELKRIAYAAGVVGP